jgi:hypothetical protein
MLVVEACIAKCNHNEGGTMKPGTNLLRFITPAALALTIALSPGIMPGQGADSEQVSDLLAQAKRHAVLLEDDAASLDAFTRSKLHWESHSLKLQEMRDHVNQLGKVVKQLTDLRPQGSHWQQKAIDEIHPLLMEMASHLTRTINHLNDNPSRIRMRAYADYVHANYEIATKTAEMIADYLAYDKAMSLAESSEARLNLPDSKINN